MIKIPLTAIITVVLLVLLVVIGLAPFPLKPVIARLTVSSDYPLSEHGHENNNYTIYQQTTDEKQQQQKQKQTPRRLLVWFHGGAFLFSNRRMTYGILNDLYTRMRDLNMDILVFDYPVRFRYTLYDTLISINRTLKPFVERYDEFYSGSLSAGTLLMGAFQHKESSEVVAKKMKVPAIGMRFAAMIGICGVYETQFNNTLLDALFDFYIMRGTPSAKMYTCYNTDVPFLVIGCTNDYLYSQTYRFIATHPCKFHVFDNSRLNHTFPLLRNMRESDETMDRVEAFIRENLVVQ